MIKPKRVIQSLAVVAALIGAGVAAGLAVPAQATHLAQCDQTLPNNVTTTLDADIGPCVGGGLIVTEASSASGATVIDLAGFTITGDFNPRDSDCGILIENSSGVIVKNGSVRGFNRGICIDGGSANTIGGAGSTDGVTVEGITALTGVDLSGFSSQFTSYWSDGIWVQSSSGNTIKNNVVRSNIFPESL